MALEWVNTARGLDAGRIDIRVADDRNLSFIGGKVVPIDPPGFNDHSQT